MVRSMFSIEGALSHLQNLGKPNCLSVLNNVKALVGALNQEKALVGAFSVIVQLHRLIDLRHYT